MWYNFRQLKIIFTVVILLAIIACQGKSSKQEEVKPDKFGRIPLHYAALAGLTKRVSQLVEAGAEIDAKDDYLFTPLHYAARRGHQEVVELLISKGAALDFRDHYDCTPLHHAALKGQREVVELLIDAGANVEAVDKNGQKPMDLAYEERYLDIIDLFNPLIASIKNNNLEKVKTLLEANPGELNDTNWAGQTPLHHAYQYEYTPIVEYLLAKGADPKIKDKYGHPPIYYSTQQKKPRTGVNLLKPVFAAKIDSIVQEKIHLYSYVNIGLVQAGEVVFTRSYGNNGINNQYVYASVSKGVTAIIIMQLLLEGKIESLDDYPWKYSSRYKNCMPQQYADSPLTIRHLLNFSGGVPHNDEPTWKNGKLNLKFRPGTSELYSTPGFGILGHVIEGATGMTFDQAVKEYIGKPVGAASFWAEKVFIAPGARIHSSIYDMALMVTGMINHKYFSADVFYNRIFHSRDTAQAFVWPYINLNTPDFTLHISGSNGRPRAHIKLKPKKKIGVILLAHRKQNLDFELTQLGGNLLAALEHQPEDKIRKK